MSLQTALLNQCRKPTGWFGRLILSNMNHRHSGVTDWGLQHLPLEKCAAVLDVGCGGGRTLQKLAGIFPTAKICGIDFADDSVAASRRTNREWIEQGRVDVRRGSVSDLPFSDGTFDLVTAVETHYYWPDLQSDVREVLRVLKPGGTFIIIAEAYKGGKYDKWLQKLVELAKTMSYAHLSVDEHRQLLSGAGYSDVQVFEEYDKGWMCAMGRRPA